MIRNKGFLVYLYHEISFFKYSADPQKWVSVQPGRAARLTNTNVLSEDRAFCFFIVTKVIRALSQ